MFSSGTSEKKKKGLRVLGWDHMLRGSGFDPGPIASTLAALVWPGAGRLSTAGVAFINLALLSCSRPCAAINNRGEATGESLKRKSGVLSSSEALAFASPSGYCEPEPRDLLGLCCGSGLCLPL